MVRLKAVITALIAVLDKIFQFQYGAIERTLTLVEATHVKFQFQYGAIERTIKGTGRLR